GAYCMRYTTISRLLAIALFTTFSVRSAAGATTVASAGDASIVRDDAAGTWLLTSAGTTLTLAVDASHDLAATDLRTASGAGWIVRAGSDTVIHTNRQHIALGSRVSGFMLKGVAVDVDGDRLQLNAAFDVPTRGFSVTRHYAIVSGSPSFEVWT